MGIALNRLAQEDPSFRVKTDEESSQTIIAGMGELHLEIIVDRMKREFGVEANVGAPQVAYREAIKKNGRSLKVSSLSNLAVKVSTVTLCSKWSQTKLVKALSLLMRLKAVRFHVNSFLRLKKVSVKLCRQGVLAGFPVVDVKVTLILVHTMMLTRMKWLSKWPLHWFQRWYA